MLVADDQLAARDVTAKVLREAGHRVIVAVDGQDAVDKAAAERPDVVILDVHMPRLGGLEACRQLKRNASLASEFLGVIFLSSRSDPASRVEGLRAGAEDFMAKPFDAEELRAAVAVLARARS